MVIAGSSYDETLKLAQREHPELSWESRVDVGIEELLQAVSDDAIDATLTDSSIFEFNRPFYPLLEVAFTVTKGVPHAWAFRGGPDDSLVQEARVFFHQYRQEGRLEATFERFHAERERLEHFDMFHFLERVREHLPPLINAFREAGEASKTP